MSTTPFSPSVGASMKDGELCVKVAPNLQANDATHVRTFPDDSRDQFVNPATGSQYSHGAASTVVSTSANPQLVLIKEV